MGRKKCEREVMSIPEIAPRAVRFSAHVATYAFVKVLVCYTLRERSVYKMSKYNFDSAKDLFPKIDLSKVLEEEVHTYDPSVYNPHIPEIDPDELSINRTAIGVEQMVEILKTMSDKVDEVEQSQAAMKDSFEKESADQRKRSCIDRWISIAGTLAALVAAAAAVFPLLR